MSDSHQDDTLEVMRDTGWIFACLSDLSLAVVGMLMLLVLAFTILSSGDDASSLRELRARQTVVRDAMQQAIRGVGEGIEERHDGILQTFRFVESNGGRARGGFFEVDRAEPTSRLYGILYSVRGVLAKYEVQYDRLLVQGHTDTQATTPQHSWELSSQRASSVVAFLTDPDAEQHVSTARVLVAAVGYGEWYNGDYHPERAEAPQSHDFSTADGWQAACRRIDLLLLYRASTRK